MSNAARNVLVLGGLGALGLWWYTAREAKASTGPDQRQGQGGAGTHPATPVKKPPIVGPGPVGPVGPVPGLPPVDDLAPPTGAEGYEAGKIDASLTMADYELGGDASPVFVRSDNWLPGWPGTDAEVGYRQGFVETVAAAGYVLEGDPVGGDAMVSGGADDLGRERPMSAGGSTSGGGGGPASPTSQIFAEQGGTEDAQASIALVEANMGPVPAIHARWNEGWQGTVSGEVYKTAFMQTLTTNGYGYDGTYVYFQGDAPVDVSTSTSSEAADALVNSYENLFDRFS